MENKYAGFGLRLTAYLIDWVILLMPRAALLLLISISVVDFSSILNGFLWYLILFGFLDLGLKKLYLSLTTTYWGGTLGKLTVGLKVTDEHGKNLTLLKSIFRYTVGYWVSALFFGLGYFWVIKDKEKRQGWHDMVIGSYVVREVKGSRTALALAVFLVLFILNVSVTAATVRNVTSNRSLKSEVEKVKLLIQKATIKPEPAIEVKPALPSNVSEISPSTPLKESVSSSPQVFTEIAPEDVSMKYDASKLLGFPVYRNAKFIQAMKYPPCTEESTSYQSCNATVYTWETEDDFDKVDNWYKGGESNSMWRCSGGAGNYFGPLGSNAVTGCSDAQHYFYRLFYANNNEKTTISLEVPEVPVQEE